MSALGCLGCDCERQLSVILFSSLVAFIMVITVTSLLVGYDIGIVNGSCANNFTLGEVIRNEGDAVGIVFTSCPSDALLETFTEAASIWSEIILDNNMIPAPIGAAGIQASKACSFIVNDAIVEGGFVQDFLIVFVDLVYIDGRAGVLGEAGPCVFDASGKPMVGGMLLDETDMRAFSELPIIDSVVLHELAHTLGFGLSWSRSRLLVDPIFSGNSVNGNNVPKYVGGQALQQYDLLTGRTNAFVPVEDGRVGGVFTTFNPIEDSNSGRGSIDLHWKGREIGDELMVAIFSLRGRQYPLSVITIGAIGDLGYSVDFSLAQPFTPKTENNFLKDEKIVIASAISTEQKDISLFTDD